VSGIQKIDLARQVLLEFKGTDAVRFLNGQITQDVRRVVGGKISLPGCVTDAKGRLQFRVTLTEGPEGALWVAGLAEWSEALEARLTRYLIADDVEVTDLSSRYSLVHFISLPVEAPPEVIVRESSRFGVAGVDWWLPTGLVIDHPVMDADAVEALRIAHGIPVWGNELREGMLPPEALLDLTDISYNKGCYVGQEVISRIKSAGKVNKRLTRLAFAANAPVLPTLMENGAGEVTSVSPKATDGVRQALGFVKRGATELFVKASDGVVYPIVGL
jgi:tRNA-modifying protein YgfZ